MTEPNREERMVGPQYSGVDLTSSKSTGYYLQAYLDKYHHPAKVLMVDPTVDVNSIHLPELDYEIEIKQASYCLKGVVWIGEIRRYKE